MAEKKEEIKFDKSELIKSGRWNKYTLSALLDDDKKYSKKKEKKLVKKG